MKGLIKENLKKDNKKQNFGFVLGKYLYVQ